MRTVLLRFPDLEGFTAFVDAGEHERELELPAGEHVSDGEWVLAILEVGPERRATSAAAVGLATPDGPRLVFEPRDWARFAVFASGPARRPRAGDGPTPSPPQVTSAPGVGGAEPARLLIVDDDPLIRELVGHMLASVGLATTLVDSAEAALERLATERFDLLVLDWNLPRMTGLDLCRGLRARTTDVGHGEVPILFLTANASSNDMLEAFAAGGDDFVTKPFRAPELGARIFSLLRRATRLRREPPC